MDRAGIDIQVLSAAAAARYANDEYGRLCRRIRIVFAR